MQWVTLWSSQWLTLVAGQRGPLIIATLDDWDPEWKGLWVTGTLDDWDPGWLELWKTGTLVESDLEFRGVCMTRNSGPGRPWSLHYWEWQWHFSGSIFLGVSDLTSVISLGFHLLCMSLFRRAFCINTVSCWLLYWLSNFYMNLGVS